MKRIAFLAVAVGLFAFVAAPAFADEPTARDIQAAVDNYLASAEQDATLVGGPGSAGYDAGFWIRGGDFMLRINLTIQARYEYFEFASDDEGYVVFPDQEVVGIHDLSGFSTPRTTIKFSGTAPCAIRYYLELEFGHPGVDAWWDNYPAPVLPFQGDWVRGNYAWLQWQSGNFDYGREAWIEWGCNEAFNFRMGLIKTPTTRQMMVPAELQQFADISMASAVTGVLMPGYTDRNRDHGLMVHGLFGCNGEFQYMFAVTNGDGGDSIRNVLDFDTSDNLAFSGRINWAFLNPIGYTEGATRQNSCQWYGEFGAWGYYYADRYDRPHTAQFDHMLVGGDLALGFGGFSMTAAFTYVDLTGSDYMVDETWMIFLVQAGFMFPGTAWEIAARWSGYDRTIEEAGGDANPTTNEFGVAINYYMNGHSNKFTIDGSYIDASADGGYGGGYYDVYSGIPLGWWSDEASYQIRFQWQLAL